MKHKSLLFMTLLMSALIMGSCCDSKSKGGCGSDSGSCCASSEAGCSSKEIYEWRIYTLTGDGDALDAYFKDALIPSYNRKKIQVGAFKPFQLKEDEKDKRYLLFVYPSMCEYNKVRQTAWNCPGFQGAAKSFFEATAPAPVYSGFETYLCEAFDKIPQMRMPDKSRTLFEYRNYQSPNEEANKRKVKMFNDGEIDLFDKVGINSVCYGEILAGPRNPALIYLTWYKDQEARNASWKAFGEHPDWDRMKNDPQYKNTATNNIGILLSPMPYSQF